MTEPASAPGSERTPVAVVLWAAALSGAAVMGVELAAVRLVAPWFGSSLTVWTNVLGVVLAALALGYLGGARLANGPRPVRALARVMLLGAVLVALVPLAAAPVCDLLLPEGVSLADSGRLVLWSSLGAALTLFLPAATVLGAAGPLAVEALQRRRGGHAGAAGGVVLCVSTLGSLGGTFATSHLLLPELGVARTFEVAAAALALGAALLAALSRAPASTLAGLSVLLGLGFAPDLSGLGSLGEAPGRRVLAERESAYQRVRVVEYDDDGRRQLEVNERSDSFQSVWYPDPGLLPTGFYYNDFALPVWWATAEAGAPPETWSVAILGLGGGTAWRVLEGSRPSTTRLSGIGVELDPVVVELARLHLDLPDDGGPLEVLSSRDARTALRGVDGGVDQVVLDTYANQVEIPPHLCTVEFLREVREVLVPGGWLTVNVGAFGLGDPLVVALAETAAAAFESEVLALGVPRSRNVTLVARRAVGLTDLDRALDDPDLERLLASRRLPGTSRRFDPPARAPLDDDHSPTPVLQRRSIAIAESRELPAADVGRERVEAMAGALEGIASPLERARRASQLLEGAGELGGAYAAARWGLELDPGDLELRLRAAATALALSRPGSAAPQLEALEAGLAAALDLPSATRAWFAARLDENRAWLADQREGTALRERAARRARLLVTVLGGLALSMGGLLAATGGRRTGQAQRRRTGSQP